MGPSAALTLPVRERSLQPGLPPVLQTNEDTHRNPGVGQRAAWEERISLLWEEAGDRTFKQKAGETAWSVGLLPRTLKQTNKQNKTKQNKTKPRVWAVVACVCNSSTGKVEKDSV